MTWLRDTIVAELSASAHHYQLLFPLAGNGEFKTHRRSYQLTPSRIFLVTGQFSHFMKRHTGLSATGISHQATVDNRSDMEQQNDGEG